MTYAHRAFRKIQLGVESTHGTAVAATEILVGRMESQPTHDAIWHIPENDRGVLAANYETPIEVGNEVELSFQADAYDRGVLLALLNSVRSNVTSTQPDNVNEPNHYLWTIEPSLTEANTPDKTNGISTYTLEFGDDEQAYESEFVFTKKISISGSPDAICEMEWEMGARQVTDTTFTGSLTAPSIKSFAFNNAKFYIDTSYAGLGGTQKTGLLRGFTWTYETMFTGFITADGVLYFNSLTQDKIKATLEMQYRRGTDSETERAKFKNQTLFYPRIELLSNGEMDSGQSNPEYVRLDGAYRYTEWDTPDDEDGALVTTVTAESYYDETSAKMFSCLVGTTMSALPS